MADPIFRVIGDSGQPVATLSAGAQYTLTAEAPKTSGTVHLGAVRVLKSNREPVPGLELIEPATCLANEAAVSSERCVFQESDGMIDRGGNTEYKFILKEIGPGNQAFEQDSTYQIQVFWAYSNVPTKTSDEADQSGYKVRTVIEGRKPVVFAWGALVNDQEKGQATGVPPSSTVTTAPSATYSDGFDPKNTSAFSGATQKDTITSNTAAPANGTDPPTQKAGGSGGGLSTGAKAGISVGAVMGVLAIFVLIFLCLRRRKSKRVTARSYYGDAPGSPNDLREKEAGVGIAAVPLSASQSPASERNSHAAEDYASLGRGYSARVVDRATVERGDGVGRHATTGHTAAAAAPVSRKPVHRNVSDEEAGTQRDGAISSQSQVLSDEERARWEEEERRLDEDIAEAERRRFA